MPGVTSVIVGVRSLAQLYDNLAAATWSLTAEEVSCLDKVSTTPLPYTYWHSTNWGNEQAMLKLL